jgi:hypothetical protein
MMVVSACGCQCCFLYEPYADAVDCVADHEHHFDRLYRPWYDLTRIGRPDWCQCPLNRALCPCACQRCKPMPHIIDPTPSSYPQEPPQERLPREADEQRPADDVPPETPGPREIHEPQTTDPAPTLFRLQTK